MLSKKRRHIETHQLGNDWSVDDPSDITLETSRSAGPAVAALGSLLTMGQNGFRRFLANQIATTKYFRNMVASSEFFLVGNPQSLGFNTMVVICPDGMRKRATWESFLERVQNDEELLTRLNRQLRAFFEWCYKTRSQRLGCSFSKSFCKTNSGTVISGLKYCFVSPHIDEKIINEELKVLIEAFKEFSSNQ